MSLALGTTLALPAGAQSDSGAIKIIVTDEDGKSPLGLARVVLDGPVVTSELTNANGTVTFVDVPDGIYRARIAKRDHQPITSAPFEVVNGRSVTVNVRLALATNLKVIGSVVATSTAAVSSSSISADSPQRKLSNDLADALGKLSGVTVATSSDDSDAQQTISLEGHDASQTQLSLDGIPLNAPGSAGNLGMFATDLFGGASVRNGPQIGGLGGGVNFNTLQPTLSWMTQSQFSVGSNGRYNYSLGESGSLGKLGLAVQDTYRLNPSLIDGMTYLDASGLDYSHDGDSSIYGQLARLRYQFSDSQTLTGTFLGSDRYISLACLRETTNVPCGYGPNNTSTGNVQLYSLADNALVGETSLVASVYGSTFNNVNDQLDRFVAGVAQPIGFASRTQSHGFTLNAQLPAKERHTISIQTYGSWSDSATTPLIVAANPFYNSTSSSDYAAFQVTDATHSNDKLTLSESVGGSRATGGFSSVLGSAGVSWKPTSRDAFTASASVGGVAATPTRTNVLSDPASLRFDCNGNVAYGNAPGDQPSASSSTSERVGYTRTMKNGSLTFQLYNQVQNGTVLPVQVNGTVSGLPAAYFASAQAFYQTACGTTAMLPASSFYFTSPVGGVQRMYQGGSLTGFVRAGDLVIQPFWNVTVSKIDSNDPRINNPYSIELTGQQVPNVPQQRGGLVLDYRAPHSSVEWLADAQYTGKNNQNNLPAYTQVDAGVSSIVNHGTLTLALSNIFNTYAGTFASPANAVPYLTQNGTVIPTIARPLSPRTVSVTWSAKFGPGSNGASAPSLAAQIGDGTPRGPGGRFGPLPTSAPDHPLDVQASCPSEAQALAKTVSSTLQSYVAQIESAKTAQGYPDSVPAPQLQGATMTYHGMGSTYAVTITPTLSSISSTPAVLASTQANASANQRGGGFRGAGGTALRAYFTCFALHIARADDVAARHLYSQSNQLFRVPSLTFMPAVGLYIEAPRQQAGQEQFRVYALPSASPKDPFMLRSTAATCTKELEASAAAALGELRAYFANPAQAKTQIWTITPHQAKNGEWYDLAPGDPSVIFALLNCGHISSATPQDIVNLGWDGAYPPRLNYTPALGIYLIRPQPSSSPSPRPNGP